MLIRRWNKRGGDVGWPQVIHRFEQRKVSGEKIFRLGFAGANHLFALPRKLPLGELTAPSSTAAHFPSKPMQQP